MARREDLMKFAEVHDLKILTVEALIKYRKKHDSIVSKES